jgi:hypothetical protein
MAAVSWLTYMENEIISILRSGKVTESIAGVVDYYTRLDKVRRTTENKLAVKGVLAKVFDEMLHKIETDNKL